ncbi:MAG: hypothetical protein QW622_02035 [Candidatus Pacearchaeota archaeon]
MKHSKIKELKKEYEKKRKIYKELPSFDELNDEFEIERITEHEDTSYLLRSIRRIIVSRFVSTMDFFDGMLTTQRIATFITSKWISNSEKEAIYKIIETIMKLLIKTLESDLIYSEKNEAETIILLYNEWQKLKKETLKLIKNIAKKL